ncbi:UNVERIFIED_CONTAM: Serine/threonine-protein kinase CBK1 [Sesamum radiatum]|uniref:Serine/threonine-protein kinase CBK1 n=1 Tax=Sesamum radiatum TaxID=300843 RepID=A0AAW2S7K3_SESRA
MESAKRWFAKFRPKEKPKTSTKKKEPTPNVRDGSKTPLNEETPSNATKQKVAAKQYRKALQGADEKPARTEGSKENIGIEAPPISTDAMQFFNLRNMLERKLADAEVSEEEQNNILKYLEKKETEYMRLQRHKMGADDFEPLTMIGKGAFGEVRLADFANFNFIYFVSLCAYARTAEVTSSLCQSTG